MVLVDDHDVYHPNLWGNAARPPPGRLPPGRLPAPGRLGQPGPAGPDRPQPRPPRPPPRGPGHRRLLRRLPLRRGVVRPGRGPQVQERRQGQPRPGRPALRPDHPRRPPGAVPGRLGGRRPGQPQDLLLPDPLGCLQTDERGRPSSTPTPTPPWPPAAPPWSWSSGPGPCCSPATSTWAAWSATASTASTTARSSSSPRPPAAPGSAGSSQPGATQPRWHPTRATSPTPATAACAGPGRGQPAAHQGRLPGRPQGPQRRAGRPPAQARGLRPGPGGQGEEEICDRVLAVGRGSAVRGWPTSCRSPRCNRTGRRRRRSGRGCGPPPRG